MLHKLTLLLLVGSVLICAACGSKTPLRMHLPSVITAPAPAPRVDAQRIAEARAQLAAASCPPGVQAQAWEQLRKGLDQQLAGRLTPKGGSALANQSKNAVADAQVLDDGQGGFKLTWTYRNQGDYDQNGEVNISDLTTLGVNLGSNSSSAGWATAQKADGDANGEVNISDMTSIGANFFAQVSGYRIYGGASATGPWTVELGSVALNEASSGYPHGFTFSLGAAPPAFILLSAYDSTGLDWQRGPDVLPAQVNLGNDVPDGSATFSATSEGTLTGSGGPLAGVTVNAPLGAFDVDTQVSLGYNDGTVTPVEGTQLGPIIELTTDYGQPFNQPLQITIPFTPDPDTLPIPFYIDDNKNLHMCDIVALDTSAGTMTFNTWHASSYAVIKAVLDNPGADVSDTKFDPAEDGFQVRNTGSQYNLTGECAGMCAFAGWYYVEYRKPYGPAAALYPKYMQTVGTSGLKRQNLIATRAYNSFMLGIDQYIGNLKWQWKLSDKQEWFLLRYGLVESGAPIMVCLNKSKDGPPSGQRCVLAYAYVGNKLFVYDPNEPGKTDTIEFDAGSATFKPYGAYTNFATCGNGSLALQEPYMDIIAAADTGFADSPDATVSLPVGYESGKTVSNSLLVTGMSISSGQVLVNKLQVKNDDNDFVTQVDGEGSGPRVNLFIKPGRNEFVVRTFGRNARNQEILLRNNFSNENYVLFGAAGLKPYQATITVKLIPTPDAWAPHSTGNFELFVRAHHEDHGEEWTVFTGSRLFESGTGLLDSRTFVVSAEDYEWASDFQLYVHRTDHVSAYDFGAHCVLEFTDSQYPDLVRHAYPLLYYGDGDEEPPWNRTLAEPNAWESHNAFDAWY